MAGKNFSQHNKPVVIHTRNKQGTEEQGQYN